MSNQIVGMTARDQIRQYWEKIKALFEVYRNTGRIPDTAHLFVGHWENNWYYLVSEQDPNNANRFLLRFGSHYQPGTLDMLKERDPQSPVGWPGYLEAFEASLKTMNTPRHPNDFNHPPLVSDPENTLLQVVPTIGMADIWVYAIPRGDEIVYVRDGGPPEPEARIVRLVL